MKKRRQFIQLLLITGLLFAGVTACDKTDDPIVDDPDVENIDSDGQSAGTVKDADGNDYNTVKIGTQVWTVENLKTTKYNDGTPIPNVIEDDEWISLTTGAYCNYDNLESNAVTYGRLYNWYAVKTGKLAPAGWHVPTDKDFTILDKYLIDKGYNYDGTKEGYKFAKSLCAKTGWELSNEAGTPGAAPENNNRTGFSALPGGMREGQIYPSGSDEAGDADFYSIGKSGYWWTSYSGHEYHAYFRALNYDNEDFYKNSFNKERGYSVRLVKN